MIEDETYSSGSQESEKEKKTPGKKKKNENPGLKKIPKSQFKTKKGEKLKIIEKSEKKKGKPGGKNIKYLTGEVIGVQKSRRFTREVLEALYEIVEKNGKKF